MARHGAKIPQAPWLPFFASRLFWLLISFVVLLQFAQWRSPTAAVERSLLEVSSHWDSAYYLEIAAQGYGDRTESLTTIAFFPLYPLLMRLAGLGSHDLATLSAAGLLISNLSLALAMYCLYYLVEADYGAVVAERAVWIMLFFPTGFYFSVIYTEALFLALALAAFWAARRGNWLLAALAAALASATRSIGVLLLLPLAWEWWRTRPRRWHEGAWLLAIPAGLGSFMLFQTMAFGDPFRFQRVLGQWGRATSLGGMGERIAQISMRLREAWSGGAPIENGTQFAIEATFLVIALALVLAGLKRLRFSYQLFCVASIGLPVITLQLTSMPRYIVVLFPIFILLASSIRHPIAFRLLIVLMGSLQALLYARWALGYWVA